MKIRPFGYFFYAIRRCEDMVYYRYQAKYNSQFTGKPIGIFGAVFGLIKRGLTTDEETSSYEEVLSWFDKNLPDPKFYEQGNPLQGITWFTEEGVKMVDKLAPLVGILESHGVEYEFIETENPGTIIYKDRYQVGTI
ncbi:MAG: hypothetical protein HOM20_04995 [Porticoccaceae bacterium]|nr:hypothetical protein [Porticoccaceae bacterium]